MAVTNTFISIFILFNLLKMIFINVDKLCDIQNYIKGTTYVES